RRYRRSIMNSYHGWWSLGAVTGGLLGAAAAQLAVPLWAQGIAGLLGFGALAAGSLRFLLPGHDATERTPEVAGRRPAPPRRCSGTPPPADCASPGWGCGPWD